MNKLENVRGTILSQETIDQYVNTHPLAEKQVQALNKINTYSDSSLIQGYWSNPLVFFFEGAGVSNIPTRSLYDETPENIYDVSIGGRYTAMVVTVQNGSIRGVYQNASTLPDQPKGNACNNGLDVPTLRAGVYKIYSTTHGKGKNGYAALHVAGSDSNVVRYGATGWYISRSDGIDIHKGPVLADGIEYFPVEPQETWSNSSGCLLVDRCEYTEFSKLVGFDKDGDGKLDRQDKITGCVIVDRSLIDAARTDLLYLYGIDGIALII